MIKLYEKRLWIWIVSEAISVSEIFVYLYSKKEGIFVYLYSKSLLILYIREKKNEDYLLWINWYKIQFNIDRLI